MSALIIFVCSGLLVYWGACIALDAGDFGPADLDRQGHALKQREIHVNVEGRRLETGEAIRNGTEFVPQLPQILQSFVFA